VLRTCNRKTGPCTDVHLGQRELLDQILEVTSISGFDRLMAAADLLEEPSLANGHEGWWALCTTAEARMQVGFVGSKVAPLLALWGRLFC
jgi:hypothetical protein